MRNNGVISDGSLRRFTEGRRIPLEGDINIGSEAGRVGYDDELELFPLHPDGNLEIKIKGRRLGGMVNYNNACNIY